MQTVKTGSDAAKHGSDRGLQCLLTEISMENSFNPIALGKAKIALEWINPNDKNGQVHYSKKE